MGRAGSALGLWLVSCSLPACLGTHLTRTESVDGLFPWLRPGQTSAADLLAALGPPTRRYEAGRLLVWHLSETGKPRPIEQASRYPRHGQGHASPHLVVAVEGERITRATLVRIWE